MNSGKKDIEANVYKKIISKLKNNCLPQGLLSLSQEFHVCLQCFFFLFFLLTVKTQRDSERITKQGHINSKQLSLCTILPLAKIWTMLYVVSCVCLLRFMFSPKIVYVQYTYMLLYNVTW